jgi:hypothetical protein
MFIQYESNSYSRVHLQLLRKKGGAYGVQISQTVYFLLDYPLRMDHCRPARWAKIIFL